MTGSFVHRRINVSFSMGGGATGESGLTNSTLKGLRISAKVLVAGWGQLGTCSLQIYGMTLDMMNKLSQTGIQATKYRKNTVRVEAGDDENGMSEVFAGTITYAWPDMTNQPQVVFRVEANAGQFDAVKPAKETSFKGAVPFQTVGQSIVQKMGGRVFQNHGVMAVFNNPYYYGSPWKQFAQLAKDARAAWVDDNEKVIAAWPMGKSRPGGGLMVSKETGMVADPIGTQSGIIVKRLFDRNQDFGSSFTVKCIIDQANGQWSIRRIDYSLESEMPHGEWFMTIEGTREGPSAQ